MGTEALDPNAPYALLMHEWVELKPQQFGPLVAQTLGLAMADAARQLKIQQGIITRSAPLARVRTLGQQLAQHNVMTFAVPTERMVGLPHVTHVRGATWTEQGFVPQLDTRGTSELLPWSAVVAMGIGQVTETTVKVKTESDPSARMAGAAVGFAAGGFIGAAVGASIGGAAGTRQKRVEKEKQQVVMDMVSLQPPRRYRIESSGFAFVILGPEVQHSTRENMRALFSKLIAWCPHARATITPEQLYAQGRFSPPKFGSDEEFAGRIEWLVNWALHAPQG